MPVSQAEPAMERREDGWLRLEPRVKGKDGAEGDGAGGWGS